MDLPDINADSAPEMVIGAPDDSSSGPGRGAVHVHSTRDGAVIYALYGDRDNDHFGDALARVRDLDDDGIDEFLVGAPRGQNSAGARSGYVRLHSGADGHLIRRFDGSQVDQMFGFAIADVGDVDGDGVTDIGVGAPESSFFSFLPGFAVVYSGATGALLHRLTGITARDEFGGAISAVGDVDNDGRADILIGMPRTYSQNPPRVMVYSGRTGGLLRSFTDAVGSHFGTSLAPLGDFDGNGVLDFVVGSPGGNRLAVYSVSGQPLWSASAPTTVLLGRSVCRIGDVDGDGRDDLASGAPGYSSTPIPGQVVLVSGRSGSVIHQLTRNVNGDLFGTSVAPVADLDGDGRIDLLAGSPGMPQSGEACLYARLEARFDSYGAGCAGVAGVPRLSSTSAARLGQTFRLTIDRLAPLRVGVLLFGASDRTWLGLNLPVDLTAFGMPGCQLLASAEVILDFSTQLGATTVTVIVPAEPALLRTRVYHQSLSLDETANALGIVVSNGGTTTIGV